MLCCLLFCVSNCVYIHVAIDCVPPTVYMYVLWLIVCVLGIGKHFFVMGVVVLVCFVLLWFVLLFCGFLSVSIDCVIERAFL